MRDLIGALLLGCCAWGSAQRLEAWRSDQALFAAAAQLTPESPRVALNYGAALVRAGDVEAGVAWTLRAAHHLPSTSALAPGDRSLRELVARQLTWIDVLYTPVCERPAVRSWCVSDSPP